MRMSINLETSAWNANFSALDLKDLAEIDSDSLQETLEYVDIIS